MSSIWYLTNAPVDGIYSTPSNGTYLEFNRDQFLCNQLSNYPVTLNKDYPENSGSDLCANTTTETTCNLGENGEFLKVKQCEICKNFRYFVAKI
jgi:hypothetical protein